MIRDEYLQQIAKKTKPGPINSSYPSDATLCRSSQAITWTKDKKVNQNLNQNETWDKMHLELLSAKYCDLRSVHKALKYLQFE